MTKYLLSRAVVCSWAMFLAASLNGQGVRGVTLDETGQALPFATIFVKETGSGAVANADGAFEVRLSPGRYELNFQCMGYRTVSRTIDVQATGWSELQIRMEVQPIELKMAGINLGGEDPAYTVMRKAIAKATYHRQQLDRYSAEVYVKGSGRLINTPFYLRKTMKKEGIDSTTAFTTESVSLIEYKRPNTFKEKVISIRTRGEDYSTSPMPYINGSFYEPTLADAISPLSPKAFAHYRFKLESFFVDRNYGVNKILVTPRSRGENLFEGYLYIVEDFWSIYSLNLTTYKLGVQFNIEQVYSPIQEVAWMPVSHKFKVDGKILGFAFEFNYLASASKYQIELNPDLPADAFRLIDEKIEKELANEIRQQQKQQTAETSPLERLASGQELTRKELRKILNEYEKEEAKKDDTPEIVMNTTFTIDSQAQKRDSAYWELIRPIPLSAHEIKGYRVADSLAVKAMEEKEKARENQTTMTISTDGESVQASASSNSKGFKPSHLLMGATYRLDKKQSLSLGSPLTRVFFNPVEGFNVSDSIGYRLALPKARSFGGSFTGRYAFARDRFSPMARLYYRPVNTVKKRSMWEVQGGRYIFQFNDREPISEWLNSFLNLVGQRNYIRLYEKEFARVGFQKKKEADWEFQGGFEWANRFHLSARTTQTWFPKDDRAYGDNSPNALEVSLPLPRQEKAAVLDLAFQIRPWQQYQVRNGRRSAIENSSPTLHMRYRKGFEGLGGSQTNFDFLEAGFQRQFRHGAAGVTDLRLEAGIFLNNRYAGFADFKHFMGNQIGIVTTDPTASYRLLDYYRHSTQDKFVSLFVHRHFRKLLLTQITPVWRAGLKENLFVNYLNTPTATNYVELGYGLDNIFRFFRVEAAASFEGGKYQDFGIFLGISTSLKRLEQLFGN